MDIVKGWWWLALLLVRTPFLRVRVLRLRLQMDKRTNKQERVGSSPMSDKTRQSTFLFTSHQTVDHAVLLSFDKRNKHCWMVAACHEQEPGRGVGVFIPSSPSPLNQNRACKVCRLIQGTHAPSQPNSKKP
ncbi:hypothetical protein IWZ01DRAFT_44748 [Phyllosticta capitalensis]